MEKEQNPSLHFWLLTQHGRHHFISFASPKFINSQPLPFPLLFISPTHQFKSSSSNPPPFHLFFISQKFINSQPPPFRLLFISQTHRFKSSSSNHLHHQIVINHRQRLEFSVAPKLIHGHGWRQNITHTK